MPSTQYAERAAVAKPKRMGRPPTSTRDDVVIKIDRTVAAKARFIASTRSISLAEYVTVVARAAVDRDFDRASNGGER